MTKTRKVPTRTCIACRTSSDKGAFVRVVRTPEGHVHVDPTGRANGRGAYLCADVACFETAAMRRRLGSALNVKLLDDDYHRLRREFEDAVAGLDKQGR